jgi:hypothetical protein
MFPFRSCRLAGAVLPFYCPSLFDLYESLINFMFIPIFKCGIYVDIQNKPESDHEFYLNHQNLTMNST